MGLHGSWNFYISLKSFQTKCRRKVRNLNNFCKVRGLVGSLLQNCSGL